MIWHLSGRADPFSARIADRHYSRQKIGAPQFVPPGRCVVLRAETLTGRALWVTSWPFAEYVMHDWAGAWMCSLFRNEGAGKASDLIREAVAATRFVFGDPPALGMVTFIDPDSVKPTKVRGKPVLGWTYHKAGFRPVGQTKAGLQALQLLVADMPPPMAPRGSNFDLFARSFGQ